MSLTTVGSVMVPNVLESLYQSSSSVNKVSLSNLRDPNFVRPTWGKTYKSLTCHSCIFYFKNPLLLLLMNFDQIILFYSRWDYFVLILFLHTCNFNDVQCNINIDEAHS